ncbi:copper chaperone PCu(A)C [Streptomyces sp. NRRL F-2664]|uniref:copper chaperone PCu(A)C n=1 Tax=Streptomyces sp. NRRL F-2664 TaxID=1463842 RepID=UPI000A60EF7B|nr:copper chaperone PCu(A)C [Streptomyces sp. NRRL F-2664]
MTDLLRSAVRTAGRTVDLMVTSVADGRGPGRRRLREGLLAALVPVTACLAMLVGLTAWTRVGAAGTPARIDVGVGRVLLPRAGGDRTAAFFRIANTGGSEDQLVAVTSPVADGITLNRYERADEDGGGRGGGPSGGGGGYAARTVPSATIPAGDFLVMTPDTLDLGIRVKSRPQVGDAIPFVLHFRRSGRVDAVAFVVRPRG